MKTLYLTLIGILISSAMYGSSFLLPSKTITAYNSIEDILKTIDPAILPRSPIEPHFGEGVNVNATFIEVLNQKAMEIRNYIASKYSEDLSNLSNTEVIALGIIMVPFESRDMSPGYAPNADVFGCMMTALGAATGIAALVSAWNSGASASTILSTLRSILRISYGWFAVGYAVYQFGDCVGWW